MENKFLDREGVKVLYKKLSLQDYPNNETLIAVIDAIDETKLDKNDHTWDNLPDKPFDEEFVATEVFTVNDSTGENEFTELVQYGLWVTPSNYVPLNKDGMVCEITFNGIVNGETISTIVQTVVTDWRLEFYLDENNQYDLIITEDSEYRISSENITSMSGTLTLIALVNNVKTLDEKYIPETIARVEHENQWDSIKNKPFEETYVSLTINGVWNEVELFKAYNNDVDIIIFNTDTEETYKGYIEYNESFDIYYEDSDGNEQNIDTLSNVPDGFNFGYSVEQLNEINIPSSISRINHTHFYNDLIDIPCKEEKVYAEIFNGTGEVSGSSIYYSVEDIYLEEEYKFKIVYNGEEQECTLDYRHPTGKYTNIHIGGYDVNVLYSVADRDLEVCVYEQSENLNMQIYVIGSEFIQLDERFIPESIARFSDLDDAVGYMISITGDGIAESTLTDAVISKADKSTTLAGYGITDAYTKEEVEEFHTEIEEYVDNQVAALVNAAPETLDTLGELAAAFEENKEVVEALDASITNKQDKISNTLILVDTVTGIQHKIQIQNGQLVSFPIE